MPFVSDQIFVIALNVMKVPAYKTILYYIRESGISDLLFLLEILQVLYCV